MILICFVGAYPRPASTKPNMISCYPIGRSVSTIKISIHCRNLSKYSLLSTSVILTFVMMRALCGQALRGLVTPLPRMSVVTSSHMMSSNTRETADIVIAGGGMVGSSAAVALANLGK